MGSCNECGSKLNCTVVALVSSAVVGIAAAFLQMSGFIAASNTFLWVVFGIAVGFILVSLAVAPLWKSSAKSGCICSSQITLLLASIVTAITSLAYNALNPIATSGSAVILVGLMVIGFTLIITSASCLVSCLSDCEKE